ncbi:phage GP46 family protein [Neokomagataea sp. TBRC 2177]|uniref:Phage GP46 family protein n=2 Tax=Neokomagataea anthophila TaxID=2826925 RepID=A0ABS5E6K6_9PROT|nr:phage GP46 family protein [Neokomagataea anthophila]
MTLASPLLVALSTDRRAEPDDITPAQLNGVTPGVFDRRGYVGDVLLPDDQRLGSRLWLFARAKRTEETRQAVNAAVLDAVNDIADYHGVTIDAATAWGAQGQLMTQISVEGTMALTYEASL